MRTLAITTSVAIVAGCFIPGYVATFQAPPKIRVHAPTEAEMKASFAAEQLQKEYADAEKLARRVYEKHGCDDEDIAYFTAHNAVDKGLPVRILSALIFVESSCHPGAVARVDGRITACGLTQVNPKIWDISCEELLDPETAIDQGSTILASYKTRYGLRDGLHHYLGMGADDGNLTGDDYAVKVLTVAGYRVN